ncbi:MAG: hypothetical protein EA403_03540, partial [Spirochaetaceae bacterium]
MVPHLYRTGESYEYLFEVTEASYSTEELERLPMIKDLLKIEELIIRYRLSTASVEAHEVQQRLELVDSRYREMPSERLTGSEPHATEFQPLSSLIPDFPAALSYRFNGENFITVLNHACGPYLAHPLGIFLHYKLIDVHSFQSVVDDIGSRESPG